MNRLHLSLYKKWFDEILNGTKKTEYRELKPYYERLLCKQYEEVKFVNGYGKERPFVVLKISSITRSSKFFEIHLGEIIDSGNLKS